MRIVLLILLSPFLLLGRLLGFRRRDIEYLPEDHPEMAKAIAEARATLQEFRTLLASPQPGMADFAVKARFRVQGGAEHCWVGDLEAKGAGFLGRLGNHPQHLQGLVLGSTVDVTEDMITDWAYSKDGVFHGHYTTRVLLPRMSKRMRQQVETIYGWSPVTFHHLPSRRTLQCLVLAVVSSWLAVAGPHVAAQTPPGVAVLLVDTDRVTGRVEEAIYGQFLEHINHSVVDGLFAEQIQGRGFEGQDFTTYWTPFGESGGAATADVRFQNGEKSLRLQASRGTAGIRQGRISLLQGQRYDGSVWIRREAGALRVTLRVVDSGGREVAALPLATHGSEWQEVGYSFSSPTTDAQARVELVARGTGAVLLDYVSMMRADVRANGMLRPDLLDALRGLRPPFIRWPGGSFASEYLWKDGIGPLAARKYHPNRLWGGYSDYYSFGTDEFMELCRQLKAEPLIVLAASTTDAAQLQYAMDWVHYLNDPPTTEWGRRRAANGHPAPYDVRYFQIDNEPMNLQLSAERYAEIVNMYGSQLRKIAPQAKIVACGQKRSNDMHWSQTVIDLAGGNFDILGTHNYEYENDNYETGIRRIQDYLVKLRDYIRASRHPQIKIAVLEWSLCRTYDWRAGLHAAGSLIAYEKLSPDLAMACPALLMRNTTDDPEWRAWIYHDHVSWFPGSGYVVEKLFREHYAEQYLASTTGTFRDLADRAAFFDNISQMKPEAWRPGSLDAIATRSADGRRIVIKAVNYEAQPNTLLVRLQGSGLPEKATLRTYTIAAGLTEAASLEQPRRIQPVEGTLPYARTLAIEMKPLSVAVVEIIAD